MDLDTLVSDLRKGYLRPSRVLAAYQAKVYIYIYTYTYLSGYHTLLYYYMLKVLIFGDAKYSQALKYKPCIGKISMVYLCKSK